MLQECPKPIIGNTTPSAEYESTIMPWSSDGVNFSVPTGPTTLASRTTYYLYSPYWYPSDVASFAVFSHYYNSDGGGRVGASGVDLERDDGEITTVYAYASYAYSGSGRGFFVTQNLDPLHKYRVKITYMGSYYNGRASTQYVYPIACMKRTGAEWDI